MKKIKLTVQARKIAEVLNEAQEHGIVVCTKFTDNDMAELELFGEHSQLLVDKFGDDT